jgi:hypothetical protein
MKSMQSISLFAMLGNPNPSVPVPSQQQPVALSSKQPRGSNLPSYHTQGQTEVAANGMHSSLRARSCATPSSQSKCPPSVAAASSAPVAASTAAEIAEAAAAAAELQRYHLRLQQAFASTDFATLLLSNGGNLSVKYAAIAKAVLDDAARHKDKQGGGDGGGEQQGQPQQSSLDLNQVVESSGCVLMAFIDAMATTNLADYELIDAYSEAGQVKRDGRKMLATAMPHICQLIRSSFDIRTLRDGWSALGWLANKVLPYDAQDPCFHLVTALLDCGCDVNTRGAQDGSTALMAWIKTSNGDSFSAGALFLLARGADLDARDNQGNTAVHCMAQNGKLSLLRTLMQNGLLDERILELTNTGGHTALQIAQTQWAITRDFRRREVCDLLRVGQQLAELARPLKLRWLTEKLQIQDLAHIAMSFVDGRERAQ